MKIKRALPVWAVLFFCRYGNLATAAATVVATATVVVVAVTAAANKDEDEDKNPAAITAKTVITH